MSAPPLRIGIAGVGRMGRHHASNLAHRVLGAELVAACSPVADELAWARDTLGVAHGYTDYAQLLAHPGLDAVFLATPTTLHADQIVGGARGRQARVLGEAARAQPRRLPARRGGRGEASAPDRDDRLRAPVRSQLSRRVRQDQGRRDRPPVPRALADHRQERRQRLLRALRGGVRRHPARHERPRHRHRALAARRRSGAKRVFATGTIAVHEGLARSRRRRQRRRDDRVRRRRRSRRSTRRGRWRTATRR